MSKKTFTAIIPFYNEGEQLFTIVNAVYHTKNINQIILVDDGSNNSISDKITSKFKKIDLIRLKHNQGKSAAVKAGLSKVKNEYIAMIDADFRNLQAQNLDAYTQQYKSSKLDMLLMQMQGGNNWLDRLLRKDILFTGFRILRTNDLEAVFRTHPKGYQLEVAINEYMITHNKKVAWIPTNVFNVHKSQKWGIINGFIESIKMELSILSYLGISRFARQVFSFARQPLV